MSCLPPAVRYACSRLVQAGHPEAASALGDWELRHVETEQSLRERLASMRQERDEAFAALSVAEEILAAFDAAFLP